MNVDLGALERMDEVLGGSAETNDLIAEFLRSADGWSGAIENEVAVGSGTEGHRAAHTLASSAAMIGAHALGRAARELEDTFAAGSLPEAERRRAIAVMVAEAHAVWTAAGRVP